jgi:hypothetical protein
MLIVLPDKPGNNGALENINQKKGKADRPRDDYP